MYIERPRDPREDEQQEVPSMTLRCFGPWDQYGDSGMYHMYIIYIYCEQNDPCSGCYQFDARAPSVCVFQRFNGCNGGAAYFP